LQLFKLVDAVAETKEESSVLFCLVSALTIPFNFNVPPPFASNLENDPYEILYSFDNGENKSLTNLAALGETREYSLGVIPSEPEDMDKSHVVTLFVSDKPNRNGLILNSKTTTVIISYYVYQNSNALFEPKVQNPVLNGSKYRNLYNFNNDRKYVRRDNVKLEFNVYDADHKTKTTEMISTLVYLDSRIIYHDQSPRSLDNSHKVHYEISFSLSSYEEGDHILQIVPEDSYSISSTYSITLTVMRDYELNNAPTLECSISQTVVYPTEPISVSFSVNDPENDHTKIYYSIDNSNFVDVISNVSCNSQGSFDYTPSLLSYGEHNITIYAEEIDSSIPFSEFQNKDFHTIRFVVHRNYSSNNGPIVMLDPIGSTFYKDSNITISGTVSDIDDDNISIVILLSGKKLYNKVITAGSSFSYTLSEQDSLDFVIGNSYSLEIIARDDIPECSIPYSINKEFSIIRDYSKNNAPQLTITGNRSIYNETDLISLNIRINDEDGDQSSMCIKFDNGVCEYNRNILSGETITYLKQLNNEIALGSHSIEIYATDILEESTYQKQSTKHIITFEVIQDKFGGSEPVFGQVSLSEVTSSSSLFIKTPDLYTLADESFTVTYSARDPDQIRDPTLNFVFYIDDDIVSTAENKAVLIDHSQLIPILPNLSIGSHILKIEAIDSYNLTTEFEKTFNIVRDYRINQAPRISITGNLESYNETDTISLSIDLFDLEEDKIDCDLYMDGNPQSFNLRAVDSGRYSYQIELDKSYSLGRHNITVKSKDTGIPISYIQSSESTIEFTVTRDYNSNTPPVLSYYELSFSDSISGGIGKYVIDDNSFIFTYSVNDIDTTRDSQLNVTFIVDNTFNVITKQVSINEINDQVISIYETQEVGKHNISLIIEDSYGAVTREVIEYLIVRDYSKNSAPIISEAQVLNNIIYHNGYIEYAGIVNDNEGDLCNIIVKIDDSIVDTIENQKGFFIGNISNHNDLSIGNHTLSFTATDILPGLHQQYQRTSEVHSITLPIKRNYSENHAPTITLDVRLNESRYRPTDIIIINGYVNDTDGDGVSVHFKFNDESETIIKELNDKDSFTYEIPLLEKSLDYGNYSFTIYVKDNAFDDVEGRSGDVQLESEHKVYTFTVYRDYEINQAPTLSITSTVQPIYYINENVTFAFSVSDPEHDNITIRYKIDARDDDEAESYQKIGDIYDGEGNFNYTINLNRQFSSDCDHSTKSCGTHRVTFFAQDVLPDESRAYMRDSEYVVFELTIDELPDPTPVATPIPATRAIRQVVVDGNAVFGNVNSSEESNSLPIIGACIGVAIIALIAVVAIIVMRKLNNDDDIDDVPENTNTAEQFEQDATIDYQNPLYNNGQTTEADPFADDFSDADQ